LNVSKTADSWMRAALALAILHGAVLAIVQARSGLLAVVLWYVEPPLVALAAAMLLAFALIRSRRRRDSPTRAQLVGYLTLFLLIGSLAAFRVYPSSHDDRPSDVRFRLPLDGPVTIGWGGPTLAVNYHAMMPDQRWAYDLLVTNRGRTFRNDGTHLDDYYAYGRPVLAPADAVVRAIHDGEADGRIGQWGLLRAAGNHVILEVAPAEFLFIAHLQPRSIAVASGDRVRAGQVIGRVGNSGNSSEPHVHLHLQDTPAPYLGEGIPFYFHGYLVNGVEIDRGMPYGGRQRRSRRWPGVFTGQSVEHIGDIGEHGGRY
jgi:murein DD-endopeptidase MepM/ murein hydrolase activator NlpD